MKSGDSQVSLAGNHSDSYGRPSALAGARDWMDFVQEPDQSAQARSYGAALAAIAVGTAPRLLRAKEMDTVGYVDKPRAYLNGRPSFLKVGLARYAEWRFL
jgi:hypothetical protein